jgi:uncharacterized membrane protein
VTPASPDAGLPPEAPRTDPGDALSVADVPQLRDTGYTLPRSALPAARIDAVDFLRGIAMVVMMLDHVRDYVHWSMFEFDPLDLSRTTAPLFLSRWVTHFCAPVFVFLAGTSIYLQRMRGKSDEQLSSFLLSRGLWLIVLELTVIRMSIFYSTDVRFLGLIQVIFAIGFGMIVMAAFVRLPVRAVAGIGITILLLHNGLDGVQAPDWQGPPLPPPNAGEGLFIFFHQRGMIAPFGFPGPVAYVLYPVLAWLGVMAAGYGFGAVYEWPPERRRSFLIRLGLGLSAAFLVLRALNGYGDPSPWEMQPGGIGRTILSFIDTSKYPPSLAFLLMTLGPAIALLGWIEHRPALMQRMPLSAFTTFGRVPLFFYVLQWNVAHIAAIVLALVAGQPIWMYFVTPLEWRSAGPRGFDLWVVLLVWLGGVAVLYPVCRRFAAFKAKSGAWWLQYL